jgi:hypothetical protein
MTQLLVGIFFVAPLVVLVVLVAFAVAALWVGSDD